MSWPYIVLFALLGLLALVLILYLVSRKLQKREPYASFLRLRSLRKLKFFRMIVGDPRVPFFVKTLPFLLAAYLAMPFDIIPDFIPVLGYVDDVAIVLGTLALIIKLTPRAVIDDLLSQLALPDPN